MHIPDGFLSLPVWVAMDAVAIPSVILSSRRAQAERDDRRIPLMGVMGAFVFAAQMINFPVGAGTSGHLVGGALLSFVLGPTAASIVMTAILIIQALVFQDGGIAALGANVFNMALAGVWAGYAPYALWGEKRGRRFALFAGGVVSVLVAAALALSELLVSGIKMPPAMIAVSVGLFMISAVLEGLITLSVVEAIERINPVWVRRERTARRSSVRWIAAAAVCLMLIGVFFASELPDGLEQIIHTLGLNAAAPPAFSTPLADYEWHGTESIWLRKASAGMLGLICVALVCVGFGRLVGRQRGV